MPRDPATPPPLPSERNTEPSKLEVAASVVVPGMGQIIQKRWAPAIAQLLCTAILAVVTAKSAPAETQVVILLESLMPLYKLINALASPEIEQFSETQFVPRIKVIAIAGGAFILLQAISIVDASRALRRRERMYGQGRCPPLVPST